MSATVLSSVSIKGSDMVCDAPDCIATYGPMAVTWCEHIRTVIQDGMDASQIEPMHTYHVPIFPTSEKYAIIRLGEPMSGTIRMAEMKMLFTPDVGRGYEIVLGFWVNGDGFKAMRNVVVDYIKANIDERDTPINKPGRIRTHCPSNVHSMNARKQLARDNLKPIFRAECLWDIVFEKACTICRDEAGNTSGNNFGVNNI